jgi:hypothetical protein
VIWQLLRIALWKRFASKAILQRLCSDFESIMKRFKQLQGLRIDCAAIWQRFGSELAAIWQRF